MGTHCAPPLSPLQCASSTQKNVDKHFAQPCCSSSYKVKYNPKHKAWYSVKLLLQHEPFSWMIPISKNYMTCVCVYVVCICVWQRLQAAVLWLTAAYLGCTDSFWIWVMQVHELNQVQNNFKVTGTSLLPSMPTPQIYGCQPSATISLFGNISGGTEISAGLFQPKQSGATWSD